MDASNETPEEQKSSDKQEQPDEIQQLIDELKTTRAQRLRCSKQG